MKEGKDMLRKVLLTALILAALKAGTSLAADTKLEGRVFGSWSLNMTEGADSYNKFGLERSYITAKSKIGDYTSAVITFDLKEKNSDTDNGYYVILKYGYLDWQPEFASGYLNIILGLQSVKYVGFADNSVWKRRYILRTVGDLNKFRSSADLGATFNFKLGEKGKWGEAALSIFNGASYSDVVEKNKQKDINLFLALKPLTDDPEWGNSVLAGQFYSGTQNIAFGDSLDGEDYRRKIFSLAGSLVDNDRFDLGVDFNWQTLGQGQGSADISQFAHSFMATLYLKKFFGEKSLLRTLNLFGRFDAFDYDTGTDDDGHNMYIFGMECAPAKNIKASVNYRTIDYQQSGKKNDEYLSLNTDLRF